MASFVTYTASKPRAAVLSRPITASSVSFTSSANTLVSTTASSYVTPASATAATKTPVATSQARHFASFGSNSSSAAGAAPKTRFWRREPPPSGTTRSDTGLNIPANSEGIPFRLSPDDCMEAYSKWFWRKTPFFRPIPPKSLTPVVLPFWAFTFTVTIRHKRSNTIRVIDYNMFDGDMGATHGIFADARMRASQVYAGYEFTREMVDILKAPANLAHPWSPAFLTPPEHNSLGIFAFRPPDYTSRFDPRRAAAFASAHMSQVRLANERTHAENNDIICISRCHISVTIFNFLDVLYVMLFQLNMLVSNPLYVLIFNLRLLFIGQLEACAQGDWDRFRRQQRPLLALVQRV